MRRLFLVALLFVSTYSFSQDSYYSDLFPQNSNGARELVFRITIPRGTPSILIQNTKQWFSEKYKDGLENYSETSNTISLHDYFKMNDRSLWKMVGREISYNLSITYDSNRIVLNYGGITDKTNSVEAYRDNETSNFDEQSINRLVSGCYQGFKMKENRAAVQAIYDKQKNKQGNYEGILLKQHRIFKTKKTMVFCHG